MAKKKRAAVGSKAADRNGAGHSAVDTNERMLSAPARLRCILVLCCCGVLGAAYSYMGASGVEATGVAVTGAASGSIAADLASRNATLSWTGGHVEPKPVSINEKFIEVRKVNFTIAPPPIKLPTEPKVSPKVPGPSEIWDLVIVIPSHTSEFDRRAAVRATWFQYLSSIRCKRCHGRSVKPIFVVGQEGNEEKVEAEAKQHNDVGILKDFGQKEYYQGRAEKTRQCIKYAVDHFSFRLLLKTDTDSWVYFDRLLQYLDNNSIWSSARVYAGNFRAGDGAKPNKEKGSKWYDPVYTKETGMDKYPKHAKGAGYILSRELCEYLAYEPNRLIQLPSEDVAVGFWLSPIRHQRIEMPVSITSSCSCPPPSPSSIGKKTDASKDVFIDHYVGSDLMFDRWQSYVSTGYPCACPEWQVGDWTVCLFVADGEEMNSTHTTCGDGERRRIVKCSTQANGPCDISRMPANRERCHVNCPVEHMPWNVSDWSPCPETCVRAAVQTRTVWCAVDGACSATRPVNERRCPACTWATSAWSECAGLVCDGSKRGERKRQAWCSGATTGDCDPHAKPNVVAFCTGKLSGRKCKGQAKSKRSDPKKGKDKNGILYPSSRRAMERMFDRNLVIGRPPEATQGLKSVQANATMENGTAQIVAKRFTELVRFTVGVGSAALGFQCASSQEKLTLIFRYWFGDTWPESLSEANASSCEDLESAESLAPWNVVFENGGAEFSKNLVVNGHPKVFNVLLDHCGGDAAWINEVVPCKLSPRQDSSDAMSWENGWDSSASFLGLVVFSCLCILLCYRCCDCDSDDDCLPATDNRQRKPADVPCEHIIVACCGFSTYIFAYTILLAAEDGFRAKCVPEVANMFFTCAQAFALPEVGFLLQGALHGFTYAVFFVERWYWYTPSANMFFGASSDDTLEQQFGVRPANPHLLGLALAGGTDVWEPEAPRLFLFEWSNSVVAILLAACCPWQKIFEEFRNERLAEEELSDKNDEEQCSDQGVRKRFQRCRDFREGLSVCISSPAFLKLYAALVYVLCHFLLAPVSLVFDPWFRQRVRLIIAGVRWIAMLCGIYGSKPRASRD